MEPTAQNINIMIPGASSYTVVTVPLTDGAEQVQELSQSDYITLDWNSTTGDILPAGSYINYDGYTYSLVEPYTPTQVNEKEWRYTPKFEESFMLLRKVPYFFINEELDQKEQPSWVLTDTAQHHMDRLLIAISNAMPSGTYTAAVESDLYPASATIEFNNVDILSAGQMIADAFGTEFWYEKQPAGGIVHLSKARSQYGVIGLSVDTVTPTGTVVRGNVKPPTVNRTGEFYNRFYVLGSSRNMVQNAYTPSATKALCTERLTLNPDDYEGGYIDCRTPNSPYEPVFSKVLIFDDIYPSTVFEVGDDVLPRVRKRIDKHNPDSFVIIGYDEQEGEEPQPIYELYTLWYIQIPDYEFNDSTYDAEDNPDGSKIPGLNVSAHFNTGALAGREFEMRYIHVVSDTPPEEEPDAGDDNNDTDVEEGEGTVSGEVTEQGVKQPRDKSDTADFYLPVGDWWEIQFIDEGNYIIPDMETLVPTAGDELVVFNVHMPDECIADAQDRLAEAAEDEIDRNYIVGHAAGGAEVDHNTYTVKSNPVVFKNATQSDPIRSLRPGASVNLTLGYQRSADTRVIGLTKNLVQPWNQTIKLSSEVQKGAISELKESVEDASRNVGQLKDSNAFNSWVTRQIESLSQLLLNRIGDAGDTWLVDNTNLVDGKPSIKLNTKYAGAYTEGFLSAGGIGSSGGVPPTPTPGGSTVVWEGSPNSGYQRLVVNGDQNHNVALFGHVHDDRYYKKEETYSQTGVNTAISTAVTTFANTLGTAAYKNYTTAVNGDSTDNDVPTAKAVWTAMQTAANIWIVDPQNTVDGNPIVKLNPLYAGAYTEGFLSAGGIGTGGSGGGGGTTVSWGEESRTNYRKLIVGNPTATQYFVALQDHHHSIAEVDTLSTSLAAKAEKSVSITGTGYLTGGGNLEADRTITLTSQAKGYIDHGEEAYQLLNDLFRVHYVSGGTTIESLESRYGFWTEHFISAGGIGSESGGGGGGTTVTWGSEDPNRNYFFILNFDGSPTKKVATLGHTHTAAELASVLANYQPLDADLTAIAALSGTSGLLRKTAANTWSLDTNTYLTSVSGALSDITSIDSLLHFDTTNSRIGIGTSSPAQALEVDGYVKASGYYIGSDYISGFGAANDSPSLTGNYAWSPANLYGFIGNNIHNLISEASGSHLSVSQVTGGGVEFGVESGYAIPATTKITNWDNAYGMLYNTVTANYVLAGPTSGNAAAPAYRALVSADIPDLSGTYLPLTGGTLTAVANQGSTLTLTSSAGNVYTLLRFIPNNTGRTNPSDIDKVNYQFYDSTGTKIHGDFSWDSYWGTSMTCFDTNTGSQDVGKIGIKPSGTPYFCDGAGNYGTSGGEYTLALQNLPNTFKTLTPTSSASFNLGSTSAMWDTVYALKWCPTASSSIYVDYDNSAFHFSVGLYSDDFISAGGIGQSSDLRLKTNLREVRLTVADIAEAPAVEFEWVKNFKTSAGSVAQYWQKYLPHNVREDANGLLTMEYGNIALLSTITVARKVETHEEKIKRLEARVAELERQLNNA